MKYKETVGSNKDSEMRKQIIKESSLLTMILG